MATKSQVDTFSHSVNIPARLSKIAPPTTIQKLILLLDDFYLAEFKSHLRQLDAKKSLQLVEAIEATGASGTPDELCAAIYGTADAKTRHTFNQLASATFRLTHVLARNYPDYLFPNTVKILQLVNAGNVAEANTLAEMLLDIAEKICDYQSQIYCLKFFTQQAYVNKDHIRGLKYHDRLLHAMRLEETYQLLSRPFREKLNPSFIKHIDQQEIQQALDFVRGHFEHESPAIRLYAKYAWISSVYYLRPREFESDAVYGKFLPELIQEFQQHSYIALPFFSDLQMYLSFYRINSPFFDLSVKKNQEEFDKWKANFRTVKFWKHYLNQPEIFAISIKSNHYVIKLSHLAWRKNDRVPGGYMSAAEKADMDELLAKCEEFLQNDALKEKYEKYLINLHPIYASLLILHPDRSYAEAVQFLEGTLIAYQQTSFPIIVDNIFAWLVIGYFCMKDYGMCAETYTRYQKITKGKVSYEYNDIIIHFYYYLAKWVASNREQFVQKMQATIARIPAGTHADPMRASFHSIARDFKVPGFESAE